MTDDRPEPKYGQYAPLPPEPIAEPVAIRVAPAPARRSWDIVLTTALLLLGVFDIVTGFSQFARLAETLGAAYAAQGFGEFTSASLATGMGTVINIARVVILAVVTLVALLRIRSGRLAFWVPLAGAVASAVIVIACVLVVILSDPALAEYVARQTPTP